jgi:hypothetical protein
MLVCISAAELSANNIINSVNVSECYEMLWQLAINKD